MRSPISGNIYGENLHILAIERKKISSRKLKLILTKKTPAKLSEHIGIQNMKVGMKANFGWLAAVCLMHAEISSWAVFDAPETLMFQIYSDIRNSLLSERQKIFKFIFKLLLMSETLVLNSFSCFWRVRNFSNLFSSTCFWRFRNIDVSNLSSSSETVCFWESEIF